MGILGLTMIVFAGIRWETGTDWPQYHYYYKTIEQRIWGLSGMEIGYEVLVRTVKALTNTDETPFLFFCASFIVFFTYTSLYKLSPFPLFSLFLLISYSVVGSGFGVRQDLSIALTFFSIIFITERSPFKFFATVLTAALIHNSAVMFLPAYFLYTFKWNTVKVVVVLIGVIFCVLMSERLIITLGPLISAHKTEHYMEMGLIAVRADNPYVALLKGLSGRFLFLMICIGFVNYKSDGNSHYNGIFNIYITGIIMYIIFTPINLVFSRLARPYDICQILIIPMAYSLANRTQKIIIISIIVAFSFFKFYTTLSGSEDGSLIPYRTIFDS
ncbi:EpsG family protein [Dyadobacter sp. CY261]|nr:EpsG family protein [Dyadobacter sp. CY261]